MNKSSFALLLKRKVKAFHYLIGGDWGKENQRHAHLYEIEVRLEATRLDKNGYLIDLVKLQAACDQQLSYFRNATLNDLREFKELNPSLEHFARIFCRAILPRIRHQHLQGIAVKISEDKDASAVYYERL